MASTNLGCNIGHRCNGYWTHAMELSISRSRGFWFFVDRTRGRENVLISLMMFNRVKGCTKYMSTHAYKQMAPKKTAPWVISVISMVGVQKNGPLITTNWHFTASEVLFCPVYDQAQMSHQHCPRQWFKNSLWVAPIQPSGTKKQSCKLMIESMIYFRVSM
jgi:hypothetical protein